MHYELTHIVLATQTEYVLVHLSNDCRTLYVSEVYSIPTTASQYDDMAELVLFYTHALFKKREPYPAPPPIPTYFCTIPSFPRIFEATHGLFCQGPLFYRGKLSPSTAMQKGFPWPLSLKFEGYAGFGHDDIAVSFGQLVFWFVQSHAVAKAACIGEASERLHHEYRIYSLLHSLQGISVPLVYGLYYNTSDATFVLILSHAGTALKDFESLPLRYRYVSFLNKPLSCRMIPTGRFCYPISFASIAQV